MKVVWGTQHQHQLDELTAQKAAFEEQSMRPLVAVVERLSCLSPMYSVLEIAYDLRNHADELRDALQPFDSGVRCATTKD